MPVLSSKPLRPVTAAEVARFAADGVVHLPGILPTAWLDQLSGPVEEALVDPVTTTDMTALWAGMAETADPGGGRFLSAVDPWRHHEPIARFPTASPLPAIARTLLVAPRIHLYEVSPLLHEPATVARTP